MRKKFKQKFRGGLLIQRGEASIGLRIRPTSTKNLDFQITVPGPMLCLTQQQGGWNDLETFRDHYLAEFSPEALRRQRDKVPWLGGRGAETAEYENYAAVRP